MSPVAIVTAFATHIYKEAERADPAAAGMSDLGQTLRETRRGVPLEAALQRLEWP